MKVELDLAELVTPRILSTWLRSNPVCGSVAIATDLADQIEAQLPKPKPEEPTGLGAVVEDTDGDKWSRNARGVWLCLDGGTPYVTDYPDLEVARVLFEGVS